LTNVQNQAPACVTNSAINVMRTDLLWYQRIEVTADPAITSSFPQSALLLLQGT